MNVFQKAIKIIETRGWCKGIRRNYNGECCILGAIDVATNRNDDDWENDDPELLQPIADCILERNLDELEDYDPFNLLHWKTSRDPSIICAGFNNVSSKENVVQVLECAAERI